MVSPKVQCLLPSSSPHISSPSVTFSTTTSGSIIMPKTPNSTSPPRPSLPPLTPLSPPASLILNPGCKTTS
ncbi:hypothetical protein LDENG_00088070 [Lucifuga dentata]|nr:hypothetical protein LDENG_00088070 [Lucifuga dentata]